MRRQMLKEVAAGAALAGMVFAAQSTCGGATLTVVPDAHGPTLLSALASETTNSVILTFDESILSSTVTNVLNYRITDVAGTSNLTVTQANPNAHRVRLIFEPYVALSNHVVTVNGITDLAGNAIPANTRIGVGWWYDIIPLDQPWNWSEAGVDLGSGWPAPNYNEYTNELWQIANTNQSPPVGRAPFYAFFQSPGFPDPGHTKVHWGSPTYYFRTRFSVPPGMSAAGAVRFNYFVDDGAAFFLGGQEVYRFNLPAGPIGFETLASSGRGMPITPITTLDQTVSNLVTGINVLAAEVHVHSLDGLVDGTMYFATEMKLMLAPLVQPEPAPRLGWRCVAPGRIELSWDAPGYVLEAAPTVLGPWDVVPQAANRSTNELSAPQRFFRLRR